MARRGTKRGNLVEVRTQSQATCTGVARSRDLQGVVLGVQERWSDVQSCPRGCPRVAQHFRVCREEPEYAWLVSVVAANKIARGFHWNEVYASLMTPRVAADGSS